MALDFQGVGGAVWNHHCAGEKGPGVRSADASAGGGAPGGVGRRTVSPQWGQCIPFQTKGS